MFNSFTYARISRCWKELAGSAFEFSPTWWEIVVWVPFLKCPSDLIGTLYSNVDG